MSDEHAQWVHELCARMKDDTVDLVTRATKSLEVKCGLSAEQSADVIAPILATLAGDIVKETLELCIELVAERRRQL